MLWANIPKVPLLAKWRLGENFVLRLMESLTPTVSFDIFIDNYFTPFRLLTHLGVNKINDIVTPLRLLELLFNDVLYSHTVKADISFEITNEKI